MNTITVIKAPRQNLNATIVSLAMLASILSLIAVFG